MATALYIVIASRGKWWVDFEGRSTGPYETRESAALEARNQAQAMSLSDRAAEVLVPDAEGKYWVVWNSRSSSSGVPQRVRQPAARTAA